MTKSHSYGETQIIETRKKHPLNRISYLIDIGGVFYGEKS